MKKEQFLSLTVGQEIYDREYNTYGEIKEGTWRNIGISSIRDGTGVYIVWDDGDRSCVGLELHSDEEIEKFELVDFKLM